MSINLNRTRMVKDGGLRLTRIANQSLKNKAEAFRDAQAICMM